MTCCHFTCFNIASVEDFYNEEFCWKLIRSVSSAYWYVCVLVHDPMNLEQALLFKKDINPFLTLTIDMWAVGCIFAELLTLKPLFQGAEVKAPPNPFQVQMFVGTLYLLMFTALNQLYIFMILLLTREFYVSVISCCFLMHVALVQLDQLDKIFKVLGNLLFDFLEAIFILSYL